MMSEGSERQCSRCGETKPLSAFYSSRTNPCRACSIAKATAWNRANREKRGEISARNHQKTRRFQKYGITEAEFLTMLVLQDSQCAICHCDFVESVEIGIDHCHSSEKVRQLLCRNCNAALGMMKDDPNLLRNAATYLEAHSV